MAAEAAAAVEVAEAAEVAAAAVAVAVEAAGAVGFGAFAGSASPEHFSSHVIMPGQQRVKRGLLARLIVSCRSALPNEWVSARMRALQ